MSKTMKIPSSIGFKRCVVLCLCLSVSLIVFSIRNSETYLVLETSHYSTKPTIPETFDDAPSSVLTALETTVPALSLKSQMVSTCFQKYLQITQACYAVLDVFAGKQSNEYKLFYSELALDFISVQLNTFIGTTSSERRNLQKSVEKVQNRIVNRKETNGELTGDEAAGEVLFLFGSWHQQFKETFFNGEIFGKHWSECKRNLDREKNRIWKQLDDLQKGSTCLRWRKANQFKRDLRKNIGFGSQIHRMSHCLARGLDTNTTCFVSDENWNYDPGNYRNYFRNGDHCAPKDFFDIFSDYSAIKPGSQLLKNISLPSFPKFLWDKLAHCHENLAAWYAGIFVRYVIDPTHFAREEIQTLQNRQELGEEFAAIQIRSIDEFANMVEPELYTKYLELAKVFDKKYSTLKKAWIATDKQANIDIIKAEKSKSDIQYASWNSGYFEAARFKGEVKHLLGLLTDMQIIFSAPLVIGRMGSNLIRMAYEYRSVDDPLAIEKLFSMDMLYEMHPRWIASKWYLFDSSLILSNRKTHWNLTNLASFEDLKLRGLCGGNTKLVEVIDNRQWLIPARDGFRQISVDCSEGESRTAYVPLFALQRTYKTYQRHTDTRLETVFIKSRV